MTGLTRTIDEDLPPQAGGFRHEALLYSGTEDFVRQAVPFVADGLQRDEAVLVVIPSPKVDMLKSALGDDARRVQFMDMGDVGRNPSRIIPAWSDFVVGSDRDGRSFRGIGEPIWAGRTQDELVECVRHEALLNVAFANAPLWLVCPYDVSALDPAIIDEAHATHPLVVEAGTARASTGYRDTVRGAFDAPLPEPGVSVDQLAFDAATLGVVRRLVAARAAAHGLDARRAADLVFSVNELATNSLRHGGNRGLVRIWSDDGALVCEVSDEGLIENPLVGRERPALGQEGGRGLWLVNQVCDFVQLRTFSSGTVVRVHMR